MALGADALSQTSEIGEVVRVKIEQREAMTENAGLFLLSQRVLLFSSRNRNEPFPRFLRVDFDAETLPCREDFARVLLALRVIQRVHIVLQFSRKRMKINSA